MLKKRPIHPKEKFDPAKHFERRKEQQEPHHPLGWGGTAHHYYRKDPATGKFITDAATGKKKSFRDKREKPHDYKRE